MKKDVIILALILTAFSLYPQQVALNGQVSVHNSKYTTGTIQYVPNTSIRASFAKPAITDDKGKFQLEFVGIDPGLAVQLNVEKAGWEVVNLYDLQEVIISRKIPLRIYVTTKGKLAEAQMELFNISKKALFARKDALIGRLRKDDAESKKAITELEAYFGHPIANRFDAEKELISKIEKLEKRLPEFAIDLAQKNLDFASAMYIEAYEFYKAGDIEQAIGVLDSVRLNDAYLEAKKNIAEGKSMELKGQMLLERGKLQIDQIAESMQLKANAYYFLFQYKDAANMFEALANLYAEHQIDSLKLAKIYDELGTTYYQDGIYDKALIKQQEAIRIKESILEPNHEELIISYNMIGQIYKEMGEFEKALSYQIRVVERMEEVLDSLHPDLAAVYSNLALIYHSNDDFDNARDYQEKAILIREALPDTDQKKLAISYGSLAGILRDLSKNNKAFEFELKALRIRKSILDPFDPSLAISYGGLAEIYQQFGELQLAIKYQDSAITIQEKRLGLAHPRLASSYNNKSIALNRLGENQEAINYQKKALLIREQVHKNNPNHSSLASSYYHLSRFYLDLGDLQQAVTYQEKSIKIKTMKSEPLNANLAASYYVMGLIYQKKEDYQKSLEFLEMALNIRKKIFKPPHEQLANSYYRLAQVYQKIENYKKALDYFKMVVEMDELIYGTDHLYVAQDYMALADLYLKTNKLDLAKVYRDKAAQVIKSIKPENRVNLENELKELDEKIGSTKN